MRIDRAVVLGVLSLLLLTGCGGDRDIDISIQIGGQETATAAAQPPGAAQRCTGHGPPACREGRSGTEFP